jgi:hypothetical protein
VFRAAAACALLAVALAARAGAQATGMVETGGSAGGDSPRMVGHAAVCLKGRLDRGQAGPVSWWFEYGPTTGYGARTSPRPNEPPVDEPLEWGCDIASAEVHADVHGLAYGQTFHYRLVGMFGDGRVEAGGDRTFAVPHAPLRPSQRVAFEHRRTRGGATILTNVRVLDATLGATAVVDRCVGTDCRELARAGIRSRQQVVLRRVTLKRFRPKPGEIGIPELTFPPYLTVSVFPPGDQGVGTFTTVRPRKSRPPAVRSDCVRAFVRKCVSLTATVSGPRLRRLVLEDVLHGSTVAIDCRGGGCPRRRFERVVRVPAGRGPYRSLGLSDYTGLRPGAVVKLYVTRPGSFGVYRTLRITRASVLISGYRCIALTSRRRLVACPA